MLLMSNRIFDGKEVLLFYLPDIIKIIILLKASTANVESQRNLHCDCPDTSVAISAAFANMDKIKLEI